MTKPNTGRARAVAKKAAMASPGLIAALKFVSVAQRDNGFSYQTHVSMQRGLLSAFDGLITAGYPIEENVNACPHSGLLALALSRCIDTLTMTVSDDGKIHIASGKYKAKVPCVEFDEMTEARPDANVHAIGEEFRVALAASATLASEGASDLICGSVLVTAQTVIGTNRNVMLEYYHGMNLPECGMVIPKASCNAIAKVVGTLVGFGYNHDAKTCTFWFENGAWLKTQLMENKWPKSCDVVLSAPHEPWPVPVDLFDGIRAIMPYSGSANGITFGENVISCQDGKGEATYEIEGVLPGRAINGKYVLLMEKYITTFDFATATDKATFRGPGCRGVIAALRI